MPRPEAWINGRKTAYLPLLSILSVPSSFVHAEAGRLLMSFNKGKMVSWGNTKHFYVVAPVQDSIANIKSSVEYPEESLPDDDKFDTEDDVFVE